MARVGWGVWEADDRAALHCLRILGLGQGEHGFENEGHGGEDALVHPEGCIARYDDEASVFVPKFAVLLQLWGQSLG